MKTFASSLVDWTDIDVAAAALAHGLGLLPSDRVDDRDPDVNEIELTPLRP